MEISETHTFKPRFREWVGMVFIGILGGLEIPFFIWLYSPRNGFYIGLLLDIVFLGISLRFIVRPLRLTHLTIDDIALSGWVEQVKRFHIPWDKIEAIRFYGRHQSLYSPRVLFIWVATSDQAIEVPLSVFGQAPIWQFVRKHLRAEQCGKVAMKAWMERQGLYSPAVESAMQKLAERVVEDYTLELFEASHVLLPVSSWVIFLGTTLVSVLAVMSPSLDWALFLFAAGASALGSLAMFASLKSKVEMTHNMITWLSVEGCFQIHWDEIKRVKYSSTSSRGRLEYERGWICCYGDDKSFYAPGPDLWQGSDRSKMKALLESQMCSRNISPKLYHQNRKLSPNVRLSWRDYFEQIPALSAERRALARSVWISTGVSLGLAGLSTLGVVIWGLVRLLNG